jgi:hypothetical protein
MVVGSLLKGVSVIVWGNGSPMTPSQIQGIAKRTLAGNNPARHCRTRNASRVEFNVLFIFGNKIAYFGGTEKKDTKYRVFPLFNVFHFAHAK